MKYKNEIIKSMEWLSDKEDTIFLGQSVLYSGNAIYNTLNTLPEEKRLELPVFEEVQMGMSTGLALEGFTPITCFPRFDFLLRCMDSLVNHLDKIQYMTENKFKPKVIIRTSIGAKFPLDGGIQHTRDYTQMMKDTLTEVEVVLLNEPEEIFPAFKRAYNNTGSTMIIEWGDYYNEK
tara:strand:+ start:3472 stop:4002 length:531 start_codon:yes stop_codon:yes gene_type:complete